MVEKTRSVSGFSPYWIYLVRGMWVSTTCQRVSDSHIEPTLRQLKLQAATLVHFTSASLMSYPISLPMANKSGPPSRSETPRPSGRPDIRSFLPLRSATPQPPKLRNVESTATESVKKNKSFVTVRDATLTPSPRLGEKLEAGLGRFLAARRGDSKRSKSPGDPKDLYGLGEGVEMQRDGYLDWRKVFMKEGTGEGVGVREDAIDVSGYAG
jgi:hypothetical protein